MSIIYSSEKGYLCPKCHNAQEACICPRGKIRIRLEKKGRGGKTVTVITNVPLNSLNQLAKHLKSRLGCGGAIKDSDIEIQGDKVSQVSELMKKEGYPI